MVGLLFAFEQSRYSSQILLQQRYAEMMEEYKETSQLSSTKSSIKEKVYAMLQAVEEPW